MTMPTECDCGSHWRLPSTALCDSGYELRLNRSALVIARRRARRVRDPRSAASRRSAPDRTSMPRAVAAPLRRRSCCRRCRFARRRPPSWSRCRRPHGDLWDRIVRRLRDPRHRRPAGRRNGSSGTPTRPDYVARMVERSRRYLYHIVVRGRGARHADRDRAAADGRKRVQPERDVGGARRRASGSSCRRPAQHYGLKQNCWFDSRRDVVAATDTALDYLQKLHGDFDDWQLALAAYNWGEGNVAQRGRAQQGEGAADRLREPDRMPAETRNYLPKLQAVKNIVARSREVRPVARPTFPTRRFSPW